MSSESADRSARLIFDDALAAAQVSPDAVTAPEVRRRLRLRVPPSPRRVLQRVAIKRGRLDPEDASVRSVERLRRDVLADAAAGPPRFLVRMDEFPHWLAHKQPGQFGTEHFERFHAVMAQAGAPYLTAVVPNPAPDPENPQDTERRELDAREREVLARLPADGVSFAMHGLDHRTRATNPRHAGELIGLDAHALAWRLDEGLAQLTRLGITTRILVPPWNRFTASQWPVLASRFDVVTGGPESIRHMGLHPTPLWHQDAVYLPAYEPFYASAEVIVDPARAAIERSGGAWTPIVLHWGWEAQDDFEGLRRLVDVITPHTVHWDEFLGAVDRSMHATGPAAPDDPATSPRAITNR